MNVYVITKFGKKSNKPYTALCVGTPSEYTIVSFDPKVILAVAGINNYYESVNCPDVLIEL